MSIREMTDKLASNGLSFTTHAVESFAKTVLMTVRGVVEDVGELTHDTADLIDTMIHNVAGEHTTLLFKGMGHIAGKLSRQIEGVVKPIPLVGVSSAYIVHKAGDTVCHVILSLGKAATSTTRRAGRLVQRSGDLLVFTLSALSDTLTEVTDDIIQLMNVLVHGHKHSSSSSSSSRNHAKTNKKSGGVRSNRRRNRGGAFVAFRETFTKYFTMLEGQTNDLYREVHRKGTKSQQRMLNKQKKLVKTISTACRSLFGFDATTGIVVNTDGVVAPADMVSHLPSSVPTVNAQATMESRIRTNMGYIKPLGSVVSTACQSAIKKHGSKAVLLKAGLPLAAVALIFTAFTTYKTHTDTQKTNLHLQNAIIGHEAYWERETHNIQQRLINLEMCHERFNKLEQRLTKLETDVKKYELTEKKDGE